jgi:hypothetical protein
MTVSPHSAGRRALATAVVALSLAVTVACRGDSPTAVFKTDTSLVGTWTGGIMRSIDDTPVNFSMILKADSTASVQLPNFDPACAVAGPWTVSSGRLTVSSRDCRGMRVTFTAPVSGAHLTGTWSADAVTGTFQLTRQQ